MIDKYGKKLTTTTKYVKEFYNTNQEENIFKNELFCIEPEDDVVHAPSHYTAGGIETIDFIRAKLTPEEFKGYCKGNIIKYISRAGKKKSSTAKEDLQKAEQYLKWLEEIA